MKELARIMARRGVVPRIPRTPRPEAQSDVTTDTEVKQAPPTPHSLRQAPPRRLINAFQEVPATETKNPSSVFVVPDSWSTPASVAKGVQEKAEKPMMKRGPKPKPASKRRGISLSLCVSEEEAFLLRKYAADNGLGFSEWARATLFQAMRKSVPKRE